MNCENCGTLLPPDARFCRVCGFPVSTTPPGGIIDDPSPFHQQPINSSPTTPAPALDPWPLPPSTQPTPPPVAPQQQWATPQYAQPTQAVPPSAPQWGQPTQGAPPSSPWRGQQINAVPPSAPQSYPSPMIMSPSAGTMQSAGGQPATPPAKARRGRGCLATLLITLVVLVALVLGGWFIGLRPYLHSLVQNQIDQELSNSVNQIIPIPPVINNVTVTETMLNNLFVLNHSPSDPVQNMHITITPAGLQLDFQAYGFSNTITGDLTTSNGVPMVTNVGIQGILGLIMSPDELTTILNTHLSDAQARLHRSITSITLQEHTIEFNLGGVTI
jgi:hypothetical protein